MTPAHEWPVGIQLQIQDVNCKTYLHSCQLEDSHEDLHSQKVPVAAICGESVLLCVSVHNQRPNSHS